MRDMRCSIILVLASFLAASCVNLRLGSDGDHKFDSLVTVHGSMGALDDYDGTVLDMGLFTRRNGRTEIFYAQLGPFLSVGIGLVGVRAQLLPLEFGVGGLFYDPRSESQREADEAEEAEEAEEIEDLEEPEETEEVGKQPEHADNGGRAPR